jgi:hypothetical protein
LRVLRVPNIIHHHSPPEAAGVRRKKGQTSLFDDDTPDDEWLSFTAQRGWIAFSQDYKMHLEPAPLAAINQHSARVFYLWGADAPRWQKMRSFAAAFDRIIEEAAKTSGPFVRRVTRTGHLEVVSI